MAKPRGEPKWQQLTAKNQLGDGKGSEAVFLVP